MHCYFGSSWCNFLFPARPYPFVISNIIFSRLGAWLAFQFLGVFPADNSSTSFSRFRKNCCSILIITTCVHMLNNICVHRWWTYIFPNVPYAVHMHIRNISDIGNINGYIRAAKNNWSMLCMQDRVFKLSYVPVRVSCFLHIPLCLYVSYSFRWVCAFVSV